MKILPFSIAFGFLFSALAPAAPRDVQMTVVDFETSVITLENLGSGPQSLSGWRFCSHDENQVRRYSGSGGLNGRTLEADDVLHIHFLNDAPAADSERINISSLGSFALPLDSGSYGIQLYVNSSFGNGASIADHLQWSIDGIDNTSADERSDEAQVGGVWVNQSEWIATAADTTKILLSDVSGTVLHDPSDYEVQGPPVEVAPFDLETIEVAANGDVTITWPVQVDVTYQIQRGTDLDGFAPIGVSTDGTFTDTASPDERAFYRVVGEIER